MDLVSFDRDIFRLVRAGKKYVFFFTRERISPVMCGYKPHPTNQLYPH